MEDLGQYELAGEFFRKAVGWDIENSVFLGGLAAFLYSHGNAAEALNAHLQYIEIVGENSILAMNVDSTIKELRSRVASEQTTSRRNGTGSADES